MGQAKKRNKWLTFAVICMTTGIITEVPYLRWALYEPFREALGQTNTQFGMSMSLYGTLAAILYIPGGWLADRISHKVLFTSSSIGCGLLGIWLSTMPSFEATMLIHGLLAVTNIGMFWPAMTKAISLLDQNDGQGKMFGLFEGTRGVFVLLVWLLLMQVFERFGGISSVIFTLSAASILCGVVSFFLMESNNDASMTSDASIMKDMKAAIKFPGTWLCGISIFMIYTTYACSSYMQAYGQTILGLSAVAAGYVGILRKDVIRLGAAPIAGFLSKAVGGKSAVVIAGFDILCIAAMVVLLGLPITPAFMMISIVVTLVISFGVNAMRGLYYAIIGEAGTPLKIYGAVSGLAMFLGFMPDAFNATLCGYLLDKFPGAAGYRYIFLFMLACFVVCFVVLIALIKFTKKNRMLAEAAKKEQ